MNDYIAYQRAKGCYKVQVLLGTCHTMAFRYKHVHHMRVFKKCCKSTTNTSSLSLHEDNVLTHLLTRKGNRCVDLKGIVVGIKQTLVSSLCLLTIYNYMYVEASRTMHGHHNTMSFS